MYVCMFILFVAKCSSCYLFLPLCFVLPLLSFFFRPVREEEEINRHSRLKEAHTLMEDLLHSNSILSNSLKHQLPTEADSSNKKKTTTSTNTSVKEKREKENRRGFGARTSRSVQQSPARTEGGSYGKRRIASVEGLTAREQDKMAEILVR